MPSVSFHLDGRYYLPLFLIRLFFSRIYLTNLIFTLVEPHLRTIEPVGPQFLAYARRKRHGRTFSEDEKALAEAEADKLADGANLLSQDEIIEKEIGDEKESSALLSRDPKEWREQDHYEVLGLSKLRIKANDAHIRVAYRKKVLRHHPDKKAGSGDVNDDKFFKCIQKAFEILSDPVKRRQFDSVDEKAIVKQPSSKAKGDFFELWRPFFENESKFSENPPAPDIGNEDSTREEVEFFYQYWYDFKSWRSFEYLDKDVADDTDKYVSINLLLLIFYLFYQVN